MLAVDLLFARRDGIPDVCFANISVMSGMCHPDLARTAQRAERGAAVSCWMM